MLRHFPHHSGSLVPNARRLRRAMTDAERKLWPRMRRHQMGVDFRRQVPFDCYILDFYSHEIHLDIEIDGGQHLSSGGKEKDRVRDEHLRSCSVEVLRISDHDVLVNLEGVLVTIHDKIEQLM